MPSNIGTSVFRFCILSLFVRIAFTQYASPVYVQLQNTAVQGVFTESTGVDSFLGVKYATSERFRRPVLSTYDVQGTVNATSFGVACPQIRGTNALAVDYGVYGTSEDCLVLNIHRPHGLPKRKLLPVMVFLHGGALSQGAASYYPGDGLVQESARINLPVVTVVINYRLAAWGFLGGNEAAANGALNLGLYDQKAALNWVQKYITSFGGDPSKVTAFGQSSGAMSIAFHMLDEDTKLFRGAILESGTSTSVPALPPHVYQGNYDALVSTVGCNTAADTFECLRTVDTAVLINATNYMFGQPTMYGSRPWGVSIDGDIIPESPSVRTRQRKLAKIPVIVGNVEDEGTIFVKPQTLETTSDLLAFLERDYLNRNATFFRNETSISKLQDLYPDVPALGSPFGTGAMAFHGSQFKRAAAIYGDLHFQAPRRDFLSATLTPGKLSWSYIFDQYTPGNALWQGVFHTGEIPYVFMRVPSSERSLYALSQQVLAYWVSFAHNLNPNAPGNPIWFPYILGQKNLRISADGTSMSSDDFRQDGINFFRDLSHQFLEPKA